MRGLKDRIRQIAPYVPGEQPKERDIIKLNTNECPYPPSPMLLAALKEFPGEDLRRYSDTEAGDLVQALSDVYGVPADQIFVGVGSDEVLALAFQTFFTELSDGEHLLFPDVTYSFYPVWAELYHIPVRAVPTDDGFKIRREDYIGQQDAGGIIFPNPNAPTSICEPLAFVEEIVRSNPDKVVIVDEAYIDFGGESAVSLIERYENLLVVQTGSKSRAMAGLRVGWAFGSRMLIDALKAVKFSFNSYTMNSPAIALGAAAIRDVDYWKELCRRIISTRERLSAGLWELGFSFPESSANFLFAKHETISGEEVFQALKARKIYVRHWNAPRIGDHLRITVGTEGETDALLAALREIVG